MTSINQLFQISYGNKMDYGKMILKCDGIAFVVRSAQNNGVKGYVEKVNGIEPFEGGLITVALGGAILSSFLQPKPFYTAQNVAVLRPLSDMSINEKIYYCQCIEANRYRYSAFGREANNTLKLLSVPALEELPEWVNRMPFPSYNKIKGAVQDEKLPFSTKQWKSFKYNQLFVVKKGKRVTKLDLSHGSTPFLGAIDRNNGIREYTELVAMHPANTITVNYNGSVGEAFYQDAPYWASDDVNILYPKFSLNKYIAMFLITIIRQDKYRFNYGRKWHKERMEDSFMSLPATEDGCPDWEYMENYIKSLPFSASI